MIRIVDHLVRPCLSCGFCDAHPGRCALDGLTEGSLAENGPSSNRRDDALPLLQMMSEAKPALIISPIYFYHIPAQAKALVDRAQCFWTYPEALKPGQGATLGAVLIAGRPRGERLFAGATLTLRYMCNALGLRLKEPLTLLGLDEPGALAANEKFLQSIRDYTRELGNRAMA